MLLDEGTFSLSFSLIFFHAWLFSKGHTALFPNNRFPTCHPPFTLQLSGLLSLSFEDGIAGAKAQRG